MTTHAQLYKAEAQSQYEYLAEAVPEYGIEHVRGRAQADIAMRNFTAIPAGRTAPSWWRIRQRARAKGAIRFLRDTKMDKAA